MCNFGQGLEQVWQELAVKFQSKGGFIRHKQVTRESRTAKARIETKRKAGLTGAQRRWHIDSTGNGKAMAKERKGNEIEKTSENTSNSITVEQSFRASKSVRTRRLLFDEALGRIIRPRSQSDRTCFRNVGD